MRSDENLMATRVYVDTVMVGVVLGAPPGGLQRVLISIPGVSACRLNMVLPSLSEIHIESSLSLSHEAVFREVKAVLDEWRPRNKSQLKEAARAFERAINAEPGISVEIERVDVSTHGDPNRRRYSVAVKRTKTEQVYP